MTPLQISGAQAARYVQNDYDLRMAFPRRPCLIKELLLLPYGERDIIVLGTETPRLIKVAGSRDQVIRLLELLDGTRSLEELKALVPAEDFESFFTIQALFFWYGLLQDGPISPPEKGKEQLAAFLGRHLGQRRFNRNRDEALQRLKSGRLAVYAPAAVAEDLTGVLASAGLGAYVVVSNASELSGFAASFVLVISDGSKKADGVLRFADDSDTPCLMATIGLTEVRIGPFILPKLTAGHECVAKQLPAIEPAKERSDVLFWSVYALQETLLLMAGVAGVLHFNKVYRYHHGAKGSYGSIQTLARVPGSETSGLPTAKSLDVNSSAFLAWRHHCGTRIPHKRYVPPAMHQVHFTAKNIGGTMKPLPPEYGSPVYALPRSWNIPVPLPWLNPSVPASAEFTTSSIANLLRIAVGHQKVESQDRRISPSGGGLKSAGFFLRTRGVAGIEDGWYSYNAADHSLETIQNLDADGISAALPFTDNPQLVIVVISRLQRVQAKYGDFAYNVVHLDAGVATAYAALVADACGWQICYYPDAANASLAHSLGIDERDNYRIVSNVFSVSTPHTRLDGAIPGDEENYLGRLVRASRTIDPRWSVPDGVNGQSVVGWPELTQRSGSRSFEEVLKSRRSSHLFKQCAIGAKAVEDLVRIGHQARQRLSSEGMLSLPFNIYILRVLGDDELPAGAYETNPGPMATWKCITSPISADDLNRCMNQNGLSRAPLLFAMVADLETILHQYGAAGYRHLLNQCGFVVGQIWLAASAAGLVGTASGQVIDEGMRNAAKTDGFTKASMFGFVLGEPVDLKKEVDHGVHFDIQ